MIFGKELYHLRIGAIAYVSHTLIEGTSPALLEAMGLGMVPIISGIPQNKEVAGNTAIYFNTSSELTDKLKFAANNLEQIQKIGNRAKERVKKIYNWNTIAEQYLSAYKRGHEIRRS